MSDNKRKKEENKTSIIEAFKIPQNYKDLAAVKQEIVQVKAGRPPKGRFAWVHPDKNSYFEAALYEDKDNREFYIVAPELIEQFDGECRIKVLVPYIVKGGTPALWPIGLPDEQGNLNSWPASALKIVEKYPATWFRLKSSRADSCYDIQLPVNPIEEPEWSWDISELLDKAFHGREIKSADHPILKALRGE